MITTIMETIIGIFLSIVYIIIILFIINDVYNFFNFVEQGKIWLDKKDKEEEDFKNGCFKEYINEILEDIKKIITDKEYSLLKSTIFSESFINSIYIMSGHKRRNKIYDDIFEEVDRQLKLCYYKNLG
jgi:hypothetical protein